MRSAAAGPLATLSEGPWTTRRPPKPEPSPGEGTGQSAYLVLQKTREDGRPCGAIYSALTWQSAGVGAPMRFSSCVGDSLLEAGGRGGRRRGGQGRPI